jgi:hypothetical protein
MHAQPPERSHALVQSTALLTYASNSPDRDRQNDATAIKLPNLEAACRTTLAAALFPGSFPCSCLTALAAGLHQCLTL